jgi:hypothetical protein
MEGAGPGAFTYPRNAPEKLSVARGAVVVAGPKGYCVDRPASRDAEATSFVLLAGCAALTRKSNAPRPRVPALLTASVTGEVPAGIGLAGQAGRMKSFFASDEGRAALARDGRAESVEILQMFTRDGAFLLHVRDSSAEDDPALGPEYWRAIFEVNGRMVTASVAAFANRPMSDDAGQATLSLFVARIRAESAAAAKAAAAEAEAAPVTRQSRPRPRPAGG